MPIKMLKEVILTSKRDKKAFGKLWTIQMMLRILKMFKEQLVISNQITLNFKTLKLNFNLIQKEMLLMLTLKLDHYEKINNFYLKS